MRNTEILEKSHLSALGQLEEGVGSVEEASLQEQDEGDPLVVGLVLHLHQQGFIAVQAGDLHCP